MSGGIELRYLLWARRGSLCLTNDGRTWQREEYAALDPLDYQPPEQRDHIQTLLLRYDRWEDRVLVRDCDERFERENRREKT